MSTQVSDEKPRKSLILNAFVEMCTKPIHTTYGAHL